MKWAVKQSGVFLSVLPSADAAKINKQMKERWTFARQPENLPENTENTEQNKKKKKKKKNPPPSPRSTLFSRKV